MSILSRLFLMAALFFPVFELHCSELSEQLIISQESGRKRSSDITLEDLEHNGLELLNGSGDLFNLDFFSAQECLFDVHTEDDLNEFGKRSADDLLTDLFLGKKYHKIDQDESFAGSDSSDDSEALPFEVWLNIATFLDRMPDLAALAKTSRLLNNVVADLKINPKNMGQFLKAIVVPGRRHNHLMKIFITDHNLLSSNGCAQFFKNYGLPMSSLAIKLRGAVDQNYGKLREQLQSVDPAVTDLDCSGLRIKVLSPLIFSFKNLKLLELTNTSLLILPSSIADLTSLEELSLDGTQLDTIPAGIAKLEKLSYLDLSNTKLRSIPQEVLNGRMIEDFHINGTPYSANMTRNYERNLLGL